MRGSRGGTVISSMHTPVTRGWRGWIRVRDVIMLDCRLASKVATAPFVEPESDYTKTAGSGLELSSGRLKDQCRAPSEVRLRRVFCLCVSSVCTRFFPGGYVVCVTTLSHRCTITTISKGARGTVSFGAVALLLPSSTTHEQP